MTTRTAATASLSSFGTSTSSSSSCVFDHANRPTKAEARAVRPRAVSCEVVGPGWVDVCCLSNRVSSQFILFIISEEWSASSVCTQPQIRFRRKTDQRFLYFCSRNIYSRSSLLTCSERNRSTLKQGSGGCRDRSEFKNRTEQNGTPVCVSGPSHHHRPSARKHMREKSRVHELT